MKIAIFSDTFIPQTNGVANVVFQSAKNLAGLGHDVCIFTVTQKYKPTAEPNIEVVRLPSMGVNAYPGERFTLPIGAAYWRLRFFDPDVIHSHTPLSVGWEAIWGGKILKKPLVGTHHTFYDHYLKHIKADYEWAKKLSWKYTVAYYNRCDLVLSPSFSLAATLQQKGLYKPIEVLRNSIDTDFFVPPTDEKSKKELKKKFGLKTGKTLIYMGRVSYEKSIHQVIQAFARAQKKDPQLELMIVGDGPEKTSLEALSAKLGVKEKMIFTGILRGPELVGALQAGDVFVTASKSENMPLSVMEAKSCGLPAVWVNALGLGELIQDGVDGFLTAPDDIPGMAEKYCEIFSNEVRLKKFSQTAREFALAHSHKNITSQLEKMYQRAAEFKKMLISNIY